MNKWTPDSWKNKKALQMPTYSDLSKLAQTEEKLQNLPPLVFAGEVRDLKNYLAQASAGKAFVLQGGDCAESFSEFNSNKIRDTLRVILQMSVVLTFAGSMPVVKIGRVAGQFAKPRSDDFEEKSGKKLPSYRGDIINSAEFTEKARQPDPERMLQAYYQSASTMNLLRAFTKGGYADLHRVHRWNLDFVKDSPLTERYEDLASRIDETLGFMRACGLDSDKVSDIRETKLFTSHEALLLPYEQAMTRIDSTTGEWYNTSAHMLWIGARTNQSENAHAEFLRGINNPIGIKIGKDTSPDDIFRLLDILNPENEEGKIMLISRMGHDNVRKYLPNILKSVHQDERNVLWSCDPMHGNTFKTGNGYKTRSFDKVIEEIKGFFDSHAMVGTYPGGIHLELTGENVTECIGGGDNISDHDLEQRYNTACDPRLNANQSLEIAFILAESIRHTKLCK